MSNQHFASMHAELGPLAFLSIQHTEPGKTPAAPTNEDRVRAFRNAQPVLQGNAYEWRFRSVPVGTVTL